jgi:hypothetical protein
VYPVCVEGSRRYLHRERSGRSLTRDGGEYLMLFAEALGAVEFASRNQMIVAVWQGQLDESPEDQSNKRATRVR